jgi:hypothetical protein
VIEAFVGEGTGAISLGAFVGDNDPGIVAVGFSMGAGVNGFKVLGVLIAEEGGSGSNAAGATIGERLMGALDVGFGLAAAVCRVKVREMAGPAPHRALRHEYGTAVIVYVVPSIPIWGQLLNVTCPLLASLASPQRVNGPVLSTIVCITADGVERVNRIARVPEP